MFLLAVGGHVCEDAQQEFSLQAGVEGRGYDDVAALWQVGPYEHGPGVDVGAPSNLLLGDVHTVDPVELHLNTQTSSIMTPTFTALESRTFSVASHFLCFKRQF